MNRDQAVEAIMAGAIVVVLEDSFDVHHTPGRSEHRFRYVVDAGWEVEFHGHRLMRRLSGPVHPDRGPPYYNVIVFTQSEEQAEHFAWRTRHLWVFRDWRLHG